MTQELLFSNRAQAVQQLKKCAEAYPKSEDGKSVDLFLEDYYRIMKPVLESLPSKLTVETWQCSRVEIEYEYFGPSENYVWLNPVGFIAGYSGDIGAGGTADDFWRYIHKDPPDWYNEARKTIREVYVEPDMLTLPPSLGVISMRHISIPASVVFISRFSGFGHPGIFDKETVIHAPIGSFAEYYAKEHGYSFESMESDFNKKKGKRRYLFSAQKMYFFCEGKRLKCLQEIPSYGFRDHDWILREPRSYELAKKYAPREYKKYLERGYFTE